MSTPPLPHAQPLPEERPLRHLSAGYGASWWSEGWRVFAAAPGIWIAIVLILLVIMIALVAIPLAGSIAQTLLLPVFGGGVMLGCHALARGEPLRVAHVFDGFTAGRFGPLLIVGLVMLAAGFVIAIVAVGLLLLLVGVSGLASLAALGDVNSLDLMALASLGGAVLVVILVALIGMTLVAMAFWFAPALVVLSGEEPLAAMRRSFVACWRNIGAMLIYGLIYIVLAVLATLPMGLGWFVLVPVIAGSCYAGWRTIFS
jgi:uncharacterized membrane protein